jgi:hypothetical protein
VVGHCSICCDAHCVGSQSLILSVHTDICKLSLEKQFLDLDENGNVLLDIGLKELVRQIIVSTMSEHPKSAGCLLLEINAHIRESFTKIRFNIVLPSALSPYE